MTFLFRFASIHRTTPSPEEEVIAMSAAPSFTFSALSDLESIHKPEEFELALENTLAQTPQYTLNHAVLECTIAYFAVLYRWNKWRKDPTPMNRLAVHDMLERWLQTYQQYPQVKDNHNFNSLVGHMRDMLVVREPFRVMAAKIAT